jgi:arylsulfatase A-like enzyme
MTSTPNILLIHSDQHRHDALGASGNPHCPTPHLDALAASGARFTQACTPCPVCTPARASLLTGQYPFRHRSICIPNGTEVPRAYRADGPVFPELLRESGYATGYVGKWHVGEEAATDTKPWPTECGFDEYVPESDYASWREGQGLPPRDAGLDPEEDLGGFFAGGVDAAIAPEQSQVFYTADQTIRFLERYAEGDRPFFLRWDPSEPHIPNRIPEPYASMVDPGSLPRWPSLADDFAAKPFIQRQQLRSWGLDEWTWEDRWAQCTAWYYGHVALLDAAVGRVLDRLDDLGLADNTIVIYTSDHGDMCGSHGMMDKHYCMYDDILRVPLLVRWPGLTEPGQTSDAPVVHEIDLAATFAEIATEGIPGNMQGESLRGLLRGESAPRSQAVASYHGSQFGLFSSRSIRDAEWKYIWNLTDVDELYHLTDDPWELDNLAGKPDCQDRLRELRATLAAELERLGDPLWNLFTRAQLTGDAKPQGGFSE